MWFETEFATRFFNNKSRDRWTSRRLLEERWIGFFDQRFNFLVDDTGSVIDQEVETVIKEAAMRAEAVITHNRFALDELAKRLLKDETVDEKVVLEVLKDTKLPKEATLY